MKKFEPKTIIGRYVYFTLALVVITFSIWLNRQSQLGLGPWGTFQMGISNLSGLHYGLVIQIVGIVLLLICVPFKVYPKVGTILNIILIGFMVDIGEMIIPINVHLSEPVKWIAFVLSLFVGAFGTVMYMVPKLGAGPRDTLMVVLMRKFDKPASVIKPIIEIIVITAGIIMGAGDGFGPGTIVSILIYGLLIDTVAKFIFKFDIKQKSEKVKN